MTRPNHNQRRRKRAETPPLPSMQNGIRQIADQTVKRQKIGGGMHGSSQLEDAGVAQGDEGISMGEYRLSTLELPNSTGSASIRDRNRRLYWGKTTKELVAHLTQESKEEMSSEILQSNPNATPAQLQWLLEEWIWYYMGYPQDFVQYPYPPDTYVTAESARKQSLFMLSVRGGGNSGAYNLAQPPRHALSNAGKKWPMRNKMANGQSGVANSQRHQNWAGSKKKCAESKKYTRLCKYGSRCKRDERDECWFLHPPAALATLDKGTIKREAPDNEE